MQVIWKPVSHEKTASPSAPFLNSSLLFCRDTESLVDLSLDYENRDAGVKGHRAVIVVCVDVYAVGV